MRWFIHIPHHGLAENVHICSTTKMYCKLQRFYYFTLFQRQLLVNWWKFENFVGIQYFSKVFFVSYASKHTCKISKTYKTILQKKRKHSDADALSRPSDIRKRFSKIDWNFTRLCKWKSYDLVECRFIEGWVLLVTEPFFLIFLLCTWTTIVHIRFFKMHIWED